MKANLRSPGSLIWTQARSRSVSRVRILASRPSVSSPARTFTSVGVVLISRPMVRMTAPMPPMWVLEQRTRPAGSIMKPLISAWDSVSLPPALTLRMNLTVTRAGDFSWTTLRDWVADWAEAVGRRPVRTARAVTVTGRRLGQTSHGLVPYSCTTGRSGWAGSKTLGQYNRSEPRQGIAEELEVLAAEEAYEVLAAFEDAVFGEVAGDAVALDGEPARRFGHRR